ncbi:ChrR family anti-sigma-E factor [Insolitispirillum peregrinum]|uniref:Anti-ECFsigma factor, ChrR n=1 Tax=Insolitispirillum peregrinum TaxID=80876 RepID=A0A1N7II16_9PROT|nr:ChrR family anti-sigma-E factor [Insolitispirillum peregrinum]SIS36723.1 anti-ECFsigma factor, ChrR [Insolitispirillum peregrinum]
MTHDARHHISDELIVSYAAGALSEAQCLAIASHATYCRQCRRRIEDAEALGGALLDALPMTPVPPPDVDALLARLEEGDAPPPERRDPPVLPTAFAGLVAPRPLQAFLANRSWSRLAPGIEQVVLGTQGPASARLMRFAPGIQLPAHGHRGLELTLVLTGSYHDVTGTYRPGDLAELDQRAHHQPVIGADQDCIALVVTEAPAIYDRLIYRLLQPFIGL